ncbi:hypothetical protein [Sphaerisporangium perillae]|uniref:hypothetical protein n=1 Tax=Sphaerisporangium perillae TaxID=2935860 RepID=UPI00200F55BE|nr:hypothetical protein [Sphaerisporangium perillae]
MSRNAVLVSVLVTALVAAPAFGGAGAAEAETVTIPKGFLLTEAEAEAAKKLAPEDAAEQWWEVSDKPSRQLELNPCGHRKKPRDGRVAMRTIVHSTSAPSFYSEQLVLYRDVKAARATFKRLRAEVKRCAAGGSRAYTLSGTRHRYAVSRTLRIGDEAMLVGGYFYDKGESESSWGERFVVARRGTALITYAADSSWRDVSKVLARDAKKMAAKVCDLPGVCGPAAAPLPDQSIKV